MPNRHQRGYRRRGPLGINTMRKVMNRLEYTERKQTGSHIIYRQRSRRTIPIPRNHELSIGVVKVIIRALEIDPDDFWSLVDSV